MVLCISGALALQHQGCIAAMVPLSVCVSDVTLIQKTEWPQFTLKSTWGKPTGDHPALRA